MRCSTHALLLGFSLSTLCSLNLSTEIQVIILRPFAILSVKTISTSKGYMDKIFTLEKKVVTKNNKEIEEDTPGCKVITSIMYIKSDSKTLSKYPCYKGVTNKNRRSRAVSHTHR